MSNSSQASQRIAALLDDNSFVEIGAKVTARATDFNMKPTETPSETPETTDTPSSTISTDAPKTGDNTPVMFWILLAGLGMIGFGTSAVYLRKKRKK